MMWALPYFFGCLTFGTQKISETPSLKSEFCEGGRTEFSNCCYFKCVSCHTTTAAHEQIGQIRHQIDT